MPAVAVIGDERCQRALHYYYYFAARFSQLLTLSYLSFGGLYLAGGSTRLPGLREYITQYFDKRPRFDLNPVHVVSLGASIAAARPAVSELLDPCA